MNKSILAVIILSGSMLSAAISVAETHITWEQSDSGAEERVALSLTKNSEIEKKNFVTNALQSFIRMPENTILVSWYRSENQNLAYEIRSRLVRAGIDSSLILMNPRLETRNDLVTLSIGRDTTVLYHCNYHRQDYQFRDRDKVGCSLENIRRASTVNK